jgi:hypothetical protein
MIRTVAWLVASALAGILYASVCATEAAIAGGPFARIAFLRPHDGETVDFEAGYIRHLEWHRNNQDPFVWHGWSIWAGERQRWFVYATFGHSAESLANPVNPASDELDNILNVTPHAEFSGNGVYEFLPALSRGSGIPSALPRVELLTVDLRPGSESRFEKALAGRQQRLTGETLWFHMTAGGPGPRYLRLRPRPSLSTLIDERDDSALPAEVSEIVDHANLEILALRPTMTYGLLPTKAAP